MQQLNDVKKYLDMNPSEFVEQFCGVNLLPYQKKMLNLLHNKETSTSARISFKKWDNYMLLCRHLLCMEEDAKICIASPSGHRIMTRDEFANYLEKEYWK